MRKTKSVFVTASVLLAGVALPAIAQAQQAPLPQSENAEESEEEIVVSGIRKSLADALNTKRKSNRITDVISSEDIGKLPDTNVAEAMQRVTGVQIGRDDTGAGSSFQVRGLSQNNVELNGRPMSSNNGDTRGNSFNSIGSQLFKEIEVIKSPTADLAEGSIGATVRLKTFRPLDFNRFTMSGTAELVDSSLGKRGYLVSGLAANKWEFGDGQQIGLLVNAAYEDKSVVTEGINAVWEPFQFTRSATGVISGNRALYAGLPAYTTFRPRQLQVERRPYDQKQLSLDGMIEAELAPGFTMWAQGTYTKYERDRQQRRFIHVFNNGTSASVAGGPFALETFTRAASGLEYGCTTFTGVNCTAASPVAGDVQRGILLAGQLTNTPNRTAANFELINQKQQAYALGWKLDNGGPMRVEFQASLSKSRNFRDALNNALNVTTGLAGTAANPGTLWNFDVDTPLPTVTNIFPAGSRGLDNLSAYTLNNFSGQLTTNKAEDRLLQMDFDWDVGNGFFDNIAFGYRYTRQTVSRFQSRVGNAGGLTIGGSNNLGTIEAANPGSISGIFQLIDPVLASHEGDIIRSWIAPNFGSREELEEFVLRIAPNRTIDYDLGFPYNIREDVHALYVMADLQGNLFAPFTANIGVRAVQTDTQGAACSNLRARVTADGPLPTTPVSTTQQCNYAEAARQITAATPARFLVQRNDGGSYFRLLPSANINFELSQNINLRFAAAKTLGRPDPKDLSPSLDIPQASISGTIGNPDLKPYESTQFDTSFEWYIDRSSAITVALFYKKLKNFLLLRRFSLDATFDRNGDGVIDVFDAASITQPINGDKGTVKGLEVNVQKTFDFLPGPLSGFGFAGTYTLTDSTQSSGFDELDGGKLPVVNLSRHSFNLVAFYEKYGLSLRAAYNYRTRFYNGKGAGGNDFQYFTPDLDRAQLGGTAFLPYQAALSEYTKAIGQLDVSASYDIFKNLTIFAQGTNVLNPLKRRYFNDPRVVSDISDTGSLYRVGIRAKF